MQLCSIPVSRQLGSLCSFVLLSAVLFSGAQLSEARKLQGLLRHTQTPSRPSASGNLRTADNLHHKIPEVIPVCNSAYVVVGEPALQDDKPMGGRFLRVSIAGVTDSTGQQPVIAIDSILQNEPAYSQQKQDICPDAQVLGLNSLFLRYESGRSEPTSSNGMQKGRVYHIGFTARNKAGFSCSGVVKACVPFEGQPDCVATAHDVLFDSRVCSPTASTESTAVESYKFGPLFASRIRLP